MPLTAEAIYWARPRVQNFSNELLASKFIEVLIDLDERVFDKVEFFAALIEHGIVGDPPIPGGKTREEIYEKRWDSYLAPIRPYGLGFVVQEKRQNSANPSRSIWRASEMAYLYDEGGISHPQFMALQLARTQFPKVTMPLKGDAGTQLRDGAGVQPLKLFLDVTDSLRNLGEAGLLTLDEFAQLARCHTPGDADLVAAEIATYRQGSKPASWTDDDPKDVDILLNDLPATRFFCRLRPSQRTFPAIVPSLSHGGAARRLVDSIPWIDVTTDIGVESYFERLASEPSDDEWYLLRSEPKAVSLVPTEYYFDGHRLTGETSLVAGIERGDLVYLEADSRLYGVEEPADTSTFVDGRWTSSATLKLVASNL